MSNLSGIESEVVDLFVGVADVMALPGSVGELYGLLFVSEKPLCMDDCINKLQISKGSVSQGLKTLKTFGAICVVRVPGERKDFYVAETELRKVIGGFVREQIMPHLDGGKAQLSELTNLVRNDSDSSAVILERIDKLNRWHNMLSKSLPLAMKLIGK